MLIKKFKTNSKKASWPWDVLKIILALLLLFVIWQIMKSRLSGESNVVKLAECNSLLKAKGFMLSSDCPCDYDSTKHYVLCEQTGNTILEADYNNPSNPKRCDKGGVLKRPDGKPLKVCKTPCPMCIGLMLDALRQEGKLEQCSGIVYKTLKCGYDCSLDESSGEIHCFLAANPNIKPSKKYKGHELFLTMNDRSSSLEPGTLVLSKNQEVTFYLWPGSDDYCCKLFVINENKALVAGSSEPEIPCMASNPLILTIDTSQLQGTDFKLIASICDEFGKKSVATLSIPLQLK